MRSPLALLALALLSFPLASAHADCTVRRNAKVTVHFDLNSGRVSVYQDGVLINQGSGEFEQDCGETKSGDYGCQYRVSSDTLSGWYAAVRDTDTQKDTTTFSIKVRGKSYSGSCR
jgi:hypothetical protein